MGSLGTCNMDIPQIVDDSPLSLYNLLLLGMYTPEWRLSKRIYLEQSRPAGVIMCEVLWACIVHVKAPYKNKLLLFKLYMYNRII